MNKQDAVHIHNGILLSQKNNETMSFAATCMQLEMIILSKSERESRDITFMWNLEYDTDEPIYVTEIDMDTDKRLLLASNQKFARGESNKGAVEWEVGISRCKLLYIEWINKSYYREQETTFNILYKPNGK